jgi:hypothetical protein
MELSPCTPSPRELSKDTKKPSEASQFSGSHNYKTNKTNYLPSSVDYLLTLYLAHVNWVTLIGTTPKEILRL